ncbi:hypothetical protein CHS0354_015799 [Potamilus streckersoni]|uniref:[histone H4]-lysine(20) N-methyltransferase n=1 Tax=Potamilus streckersoni TaxID=2493646 RepID=A0AAE0SDB9_9BIVA|nr:hypothetical protein CHS0354_015799 [Potamilus streckersoni]
MSSDVKGSTGRITDYFHWSPPLKSSANNDDDVPTQKDYVEKSEEGHVKDEPEENLDLSTSSVFLTPDNSPSKDDHKTQISVEKKGDNDRVSDPPKSKQKFKEENQKLDKANGKGRCKKVETTVKQAVKQTSSQGPARLKSARKKKTEEPVQRNKLVTDYFPVRRSDRKCKSDVEKEKLKDLEQKILSKIEDGLKVTEIDNKGRGVIADKEFLRGDFIVEYAGDLIDRDVAKNREKKYSEKPEYGCYMYYFSFKNKNYCVDATAESGRLGRLLNHSKTAANCQTKLVEVNGQPRLILVALKDITKGEELLYDYGDRSKSSVEAHPWLQS